jgi:hypothetical protein
MRMILRNFASNWTLPVSLSCHDYSIAQASRNTQQKLEWTPEVYHVLGCDTVRPPSHHVESLTLNLTAFSASVQNSESNIMTGWMIQDNQSSIPCTGNIFYFPISSRPALGRSPSPIQRILGTISPGVKRPEFESNHSPIYRAIVKNIWAIPPRPHMTSWCSA